MAQPGNDVAAITPSSGTIGEVKCMTQAKLRTARDPCLHGIAQLLSACLECMALSLYGRLVAQGLVLDGKFFSF